MPPSFCRHNRFIQNCPICRAPEPPAAQRTRTARTTTGRARASSGAAARPGRAGGVRVRQLVQAADDGYRSQLVAGLKASADAERLAEELAFAAGRLAELAADPPGIYAEIAAQGDPEEALWLAFLTAYLGPNEDEDEDEDAFAGIRAAHVAWASGELPDLAAPLGPRTSHDRADGPRTVLAYRARAQRAGSQELWFAGEPAWTPERRFDRLFERLALPGLSRAGRYDLLVVLGRLGVADLRPASLQLTDDATTVAAKRVFGIGDTLLLERRARELADATELPIEALDLALFNWAAPPGGRVTMGSGATPDDALRDEVAAVLGA